MRFIYIKNHTTTRWYVYEGLHYFERDVFEKREIKNRYILIKISLGLISIDDEWMVAEAQGIRLSEYDL